RHTRCYRDWSSDVCSSDLYYVTKAYREKGFNPTDKETWKREPPTVQDVIHLMQQEFDHLKLMKQVTVLTLIDRLQAVASGAFGRSEERRVGKECRLC